MARKEKSVPTAVKNTPPAGDEKIKVKFLVPAGVPGGVQFEAGKIYTLNPASAYRWERRGVCEYV